MKKLSIVFVILCFTLMVLPAVTMPLFQDAVNTEKRELSELPPIIKEDGHFNSSFSVDMNTWIQEHIGFRNLMISANSLLRTELFGQGAKEEIVVGEDGWLFYGESVNDYLNVSTISPRNAANAAHAMAMLERYAEKQGSRFLLALVANKNTLYGENMPYYYLPRRADGNRELFLAALDAEQVRYVDLLPYFQKEEKQLYQKTDSHWTYEGALLGYRSILRASGLPHNNFTGMQFKEEQNWPADLAIFLYGEAAEPEWQAYPDYTFTYSYRTRNPAVDSLTLETYQPAGSGSLVIYRDSFCNTMQAYLAENFESALFSRVLPYQADLIRTRQPDLTVMQVTERTLGSFVYRAPQMEAPEVELDTDMKLLPSSYLSAHHEQSGKYEHYYGTVSERLLADTYRVYAVVKTGDETRAFEAFPIYEAELLGPSDVTDNGWSFYLPREVLQEETLLMLMVESGDARYLILFPEGGM